MKFYNFLLLTKWKGKKWLMKDKVRSENDEMRVIKWDRKRVWNDDRRERERERAQWMIPATIKSQVAEESKVVSVTKENSWLQYLSCYCFIFLGKIKLGFSIFLKWVERVSNLNDKGFFLFVFEIAFCWIFCLFVVVVWANF